MKESDFATLGMRFRAAFVDGMIVAILTFVPIVGLALAFPDHVAFPFFTSQETEELEREVTEQDGTKITTLTYFTKTFDMRGHLISESKIRETIRESGRTTTRVWVSVGPIKRGVVKLDSLVWIVIILYGTYFEMGPRSATIGKRLVGIRVVKTDNTPLSLGRAIWRNIAEFACYSFIFYLFAIFTRRKQGLHDLLAGTVVVRHVATGDSLSDE